MRIVRYIIRFLMALVFIIASGEKLFLPYSLSVCSSDMEMTDPKFFEFYGFLLGTGYLYFIGFFQFLNDLLPVCRGAYLTDAVMIVPLILCLLMTNMFISRYLSFILFDGVMFLLILSNLKKLKSVFLKSQSTLF